MTISNDTKQDVEVFSYLSFFGSLASLKEGHTGGPSKRPSKTPTVRTAIRTASVTPP